MEPPKIQVMEGKQNHEKVRCEKEADGDETLDLLKEESKL